MSLMREIGRQVFGSGRQEPTPQRPRKSKFVQANDYAKIDDADYEAMEDYYDSYSKAIISAEED